jgi:hypothetical protein
MCLHHHSWLSGHSFLQRKTWSYLWQGETAPLWSQGRIQDFLKGGGGGGEVASTACTTVARHNLSVHCDLSQPPQVMHKVWKLLLCLEKCYKFTWSVLDNHCCQKDVISNICLDVEMSGLCSGHLIPSPPPPQLSPYVLNFVMSHDSSCHMILCPSPIHLLLILHDSLSLMSHDLYLIGTVCDKEEAMLQKCHVCDMIGWWRLTTSPAYKPTQVTKSQPALTMVPLYHVTYCVVAAVWDNPEPKDHPGHNTLQPYINSVLNRASSEITAGQLSGVCRPCQIMLAFFSRIIVVHGHCWIILAKWGNNW